MKLKFSDEKHIFNIHTDGIPHLSVDMLDSLGVPNLFTTRFISYDPETGTGQKGLRLAVMHDEDIAEASPDCRKNRDILAHQLGSSISMECITDQKHTNYVHVASREDLGIPTVGNFALHRHYVDGVVTGVGRKDHADPKVKEELTHLLSSRYKETITLNNDMLVRTRPGEKEFEQYDLDGNDETWSFDVMGIIEKLKAGKKVK